MGPLKEQRVLLSAKPSLQPPLPIYTLISIYVDFIAPSPQFLPASRRLSSWLCLLLTTFKIPRVGSWCLLLYVSGCLLLPELSKRLSLHIWHLQKCLPLFWPHNDIFIYSFVYCKSLFEGQKVLAKTNAFMFYVLCHAHRIATCFLFFFLNHTLKPAQASWWFQCVDF